MNSKRHHKAHLELKILKRKGIKVLKRQEDKKSLKHVLIITTKYQFNIYQKSLTHKSSSTLQTLTNHIRCVNCFIPLYFRRQLSSSMCVLQPSVVLDSSSSSFFPFIFSEAFRCLLPGEHKTLRQFVCSGLMITNNGVLHLTSKC